MKCILIDPYDQTVEMVETDDDLDELLGGDASQIWIVSEKFPDCLGYVDAKGITRWRKVWYFHGVSIWGPMAILDREDQPPTCSLEDVRAMVSFER